MYLASVNTLSSLFRMRLMKVQNGFLDRIAASDGLECSCRKNVMRSFWITGFGALLKLGKSTARKEAGHQTESSKCRQRPRRMLGVRRMESPGNTEKVSSAENANQAPVYSGVEIPSHRNGSINFWRSKRPHQSQTTTLARWQKPKRRAQ